MGAFLFSSTINVSPDLIANDDRAALLSIICNSFGGKPKRTIIKKNFILLSKIQFYYFQNCLFLFCLSVLEFFPFKRPDSLIENRILNRAILNFTVN